MKIKYRIPSKGPYGFVEIEKEVDDVTPFLTATLAVEELEQLMGLQKEADEGPGLSPKEWNKAVDEYLLGNAMHPDTYYAMSGSQQRVIQAIKLSLKRIKAKGELPADEE